MYHIYTHIHMYMYICIYIYQAFCLSLLERFSHNRALHIHKKNVYVPKIPSNFENSPVFPHKSPTYAPKSYISPWRIRKGTLFLFLFLSLSLPPFLSPSPSFPLSLSSLPFVSESISVSLCVCLCFCVCACTFLCVHV